MEDENRIILEKDKIYHNFIFLSQNVFKIEYEFKKDKRKKGEANLKY